MFIFQPGTHIGPHKVVRFLASGEVADVYEVIAPGVGRAALKLLRQGIKEELKAPARLKQEGEAIATIVHVNVVRFHCGGELEGHPYLVIELVQGPDLRRMMKEAGGALPIDRVVGIVRQACDGVAAAHRAGVIHRDLQPDNILVTADGTTKLADFGSAKLTVWGMVTTTNHEVLSALYLAPEVLTGRPAEAKSDVYSLGVVLYEAIAGVHPLRLPPANAMTICKHRFEHRELPAPLATLGLEVPGDLSDLVQQALAWEPADRCSLRELANGLDSEIQRSLAPRRIAARNAFASKEKGFARTEPAIPAAPSIPPAQRLGPHGTMPLAAFGGRPAALPPEPADRIVTKRSPPVAKPAQVTVPMAEVVAMGERRTTAIPVEQTAARASAAAVERGPRRWIPWAAGGVAALGLGWLGAGWVLGTRDGETRRTAAPPPVPSISASAAPVASASAPPAAPGSGAGPSRPAPARRPPRPR